MEMLKTKDKEHKREFERESSRTEVNSFLLGSHDVISWSVIVVGTKGLR